MKIEIDMTQHEVNQIRELIEERDYEGICKVLETTVFQSIFDIQRQIKEYKPTNIPRISLRDAWNSSA